MYLNKRILILFCIRIGTILNTFRKSNKIFKYSEQVRLQGALGATPPPPGLYFKKICILLRQK